MKWFGREVSSFIERNNDWNSYIIEGISIHPKFIGDFKKQGYEIITIFLVDRNQKRIRDILYSRGLWDEAGNYPDSVKEIEKEYLLQTNEYYLDQIQEYKFPYFEIKDDRDETIGDVLDYLDKKLILNSKN